MRMWSSTVPERGGISLRVMYTIGLMKLHPKFIFVLPGHDFAWR